jgi:death-associated protein kinase
MSFWEFSGYEQYYSIYDHFVGDPNCIHVVVFRCSDPQQTQQEQIKFWLNFIRARIAIYSRSLLPSNQGLRK